MIVSFVRSPSRRDKKGGCGMSAPLPCTLPGTPPCMAGLVQRRLAGAPRLDRHPPRSCGHAHVPTASGSRLMLDFSFSVCRSSVVGKFQRRSALPGSPGPAPHCLDLNNSVLPAFWNWILPLSLRVAGASPYKYLVLCSGWWAPHLRINSSLSLNMCLSLPLCP